MNDDFKEGFKDGYKKGAQDGMRQFARILTTSINKLAHENVDAIVANMIDQAQKAQAKEEDKAKSRSFDELTKQPTFQ